MNIGKSSSGDKIVNFSDYEVGRMRINGGI